MKLITEYLSIKVNLSKIVPKDDGEDLRNIVRSELERLGKSANLNHINVSKITNFKRVFYLKNFTGDISQWDMRSAINTDSMFAGNTNFNPDYLGEWKFTQLKNANHMFAACYHFNGIGLRNWNVETVEDFSYMFVSCEDFNEDISSWKVNNAKTLEKMFENTQSFDQDLSSWKISKYCPMIDAFKNSKMNRKKNHFPTRIY